MTLKNDARSDDFLSDVAGLLGYGCTINLYGDSVQVLTIGACTEDILFGMGFAYSKKNDFYWKKY